MAEIKSKIEKLELLDGETVELTLNFKRLLMLRATGYEKAVNEAMRFLVDDKNIDVLRIPSLMWVAYLCATNNPVYTEDEFIGLLPWDLSEMTEIIQSLNNKKKAEVSKIRSSAASKKAK